MLLKIWVDFQAFLLFINVHLMMKSIFLFVRQISNVRQQVYRELATLLRMACGIVEEVGIELGENSDKLSDQFDHLSESEQMIQDLLESAERVKMTLLNIQEKE
jgi:hypothetical protein